MDGMLEQWIVHICKRTDWETAQTEGQYLAASLSQEGFIHCSRPSQVLWVANRFFPQELDLVLLWLDPEQLHAELRWEPAEGQFFPHIYGPINLQAVREVEEFPPEPDGIFRQPPEGGNIVAT